MGLFGKRYIRFTENEYTFYQKRIYILLKTDIRFTKTYFLFTNTGVTFYQKRRYDLTKTDVNFFKNGGTFLQERIDDFLTIYISDSYKRYDFLLQNLDISNERRIISE